MVILVLVVVEAMVILYNHQLCLCEEKRKKTIKIKNLSFSCCWNNKLKKYKTKQKKNYPIKLRLRWLYLSLLHIDCLATFNEKLFYICFSPPNSYVLSMLSSLLSFCNDQYLLLLFCLVSNDQSNKINQKTTTANEYNPINWCNQKGESNVFFSQT